MKLGGFSGIRDTDCFAETSALVRAQLLEEASLSSILIGRQSAEQVLDLIRGATEAGTSG